MLQQRAKLRWLKHGDQNSKVFFRKINSTRVKQRVFQITNINGETLTNQQEVIQEFVSYFQTLLGGNSPHRTVDLGFLQHEIRQITTAEASLLVAPATAHEVKEAFFEIDVESAPGPDGFGSAFYRAAWPVIGQSMVEAVGEFFRTAITKIMVKRIQRVLPLLINYSQNAFVPGRSIADNILLAQELLAGYNQARLPERCTLKVDIQKAYDSVEWDFLLEGLKVNPAKSQIILSRAVQQQRQQLLDCVGFQEGSLPIKYLDENFPLARTGGEGQAKVAWDQICKPKAEGGLGLRSLIIMNQALILKQLWRILQNDGSSIGWTGFSKIGFDTLQFGHSIAQRDPWHERGPLCLSFPRGIEVTGLPLSSTLSSVLQRNQWCWPAATDSDIVEIISLLPPTTPSAGDTICWRSNSGKFTLTSAVHLIQPPSPHAHWQGLLQGKFKIPRHGFILWLASWKNSPPWISHGYQGLKMAVFYVEDRLVRPMITYFSNVGSPKRCLTILNHKVKFQWPYLEWQRGIMWQANVCAVIT
ncbi:UNVERIFIED_CONTAM: hypothetical protein Sangu_2586200 [Sesamum angustifolium]|uniref:Reverse transcriptase domain-containing protein n=1 Tax=Sesamum angustifolium TaxID=2727405 RepID=A0AAW2J7P0_9LAMI